MPQVKVFSDANLANDSTKTIKKRIDVEQKPLDEREVKDIC